ncbi:MAG TPA: N(4)-(beta-N-acetylglucosaminyl)-L-asparaginase [Thermomicrobiales bacterium]|nr:N(4)-(beta-N-acetylglucosaminyl)-L-asparaginase [Thermomicrobiales bacterium]
MIVVASSNGRVGIRQAVEVLRRGGSALDAVVAGIEPVESNPEDHSVGYSGLPNLIGEVELDASLMDGRTLAAGAVGAIRNYEHPIAIARKVMEELPHVLIVGAGAERFAKEMGFPEKDLLTPEAQAIWSKRLEDRAGTDPNMVKYMETMSHFAKLAADPEKPNETVNFIAQDREGNIACGVSTSGWSWKYPGRLGDSPIIAAGNYADNRYGAAACTGRGEMAIRAATARSVVLYLKMGLNLNDALAEAMRDLHAVDDAYAGGMNIIALDKEGTPNAATNRQGATFIFMRDDMEDYEERERLYVP